MATRSSIVVITKDANYVQFYRHYDGYPEKVKPEIESFLEKDLLKAFRESGKYMEEDYPTIHGDADYLYFVYEEQKHITPLRVSGNVTRWTYFPPSTFQT